MLVCEYCGKEYTPSVTSQAKKYKTRFCSQKCASKASWANGKRKKYERIPAERPFTHETVYLVKMWHEKGDSPEKIAAVLSRPVATIEAILRGDLK